MTNEIQEKQEALAKWANSLADQWIDEAEPAGWSLESGNPILSSETVLEGFWEQLTLVTRMVDQGDMPNIEGLMRVEALLNVAAGIGAHAAEHEVDLP